MSNICPNCKVGELNSFYRVEKVPVHSVLLMETEEEAVNYPTWDIDLGFCSNCGFISNSVFNKDIQEYSSKYEETQGYSGTFNKFHEGLAKRLIEKYNLVNKTVLEIGCGKGDFITMLCDFGDNRGYGFDPAFLPERNPDKNDRVQFITDFYTEKYSEYKADFVCCKMTLEHIPDTLDFMNVVRNAIGNNNDTIVFFQIPETSRILKDLGFWDIYYEHCSYFSYPSLEYLFRKAGFDVLDMGTDYDDQYLMIEAKPSLSKTQENNITVDLKEINESLISFKSRITKNLDQWRDLLQSYRLQDKKVVLWGGGSKAVAFLTTVDTINQIKYAVDINPHKQGCYLPGSGQEVIAPSDLISYNPDVVIVMNPIYMKEIGDDLKKLNLDPELLPIDFLIKNESKSNIS